jgi:hypothetical protein
MVEGMNSSIIYLIHCKNFCKYHNVSLPSTITTTTKVYLQVPKRSGWSASWCGRDFLGLLYTISSVFAFRFGRIQGSIFF